MRRAEEQLRYSVIEKIYSSARERYECEREQYRFACGSHADGDYRRHSEPRESRYSHMHGVKQQRAPEHDGRAEVGEIQYRRDREREQHRRFKHGGSCEPMSRKQTRAADAEAEIYVAFCLA